MLTDIFDLDTAMSYITTVNRADFAVAVPIAFRFEHEETGLPAWGVCGFVPHVKLYVDTGVFEDRDGKLHWIGP